MTIKEIYEKISGNYDEAIKRMMKEDLVKRFALKFLNDQSYHDLEVSLENGEIQEAFRAAHTLKGVSANLAFTKLNASSSAITEMLRDEKLEDAINYFPNVTLDYNQTVDAIKQLD